MRSALQKVGPARGLQRREKPVRSLNDYLSSRAAAQEQVEPEVLASPAGQDQS